MKKWLNSRSHKYCLEYRQKRKDAHKKVIKSKNEAGQKPAKEIGNTGANQASKV